MSETPVRPTPVRDVLLGIGESFSKRGKRGFLAAAGVMLGALVAILYFTVFPVPRSPAQSEPVQSGPRLDQGAIAVANTFTKLGWNEHNCRAASRYSVGARCPARVLPAGTYKFVLNTWLIRPHCANTRPNSPSETGHISPSCIQYSATNNETVSYTMAKMPQGWRIVGVNASRGGQ